MVEAHIEKKKGISPVWILPLVAIILGGWLLFTSIYEDGIDITLRVEDSSGIIANKTPVMFKGNQVGLVKKIQLRRDMQGVDLIIEMNKGAKPYLVEDMIFWIEQVEVQAGRINGLDTLLSGSYIGVQLGTSQTPSHNFVAHNRRPPVPLNAPGLHCKLRAPTFQSLDIGSGIYNQSIQIGSVQNYALQEDNSVLIDIYIEPEFKHLVKKQTRFWNSSGITVSGGIANLQMHMTSLSSLLQGGINMQTPESAKDSPDAENGHIFLLHDNLSAVDGLNKPVGLNLVLETSNLASIKVGSAVYYRKVKVGEVTGTELSKSFQKVLIKLTIYNQFAAVVREHTRFWNSSGIQVSGGVLSGISLSTESLDALLNGGIALATPDNEEMGGPVSNGHHFILEDKEEEAWRAWSPDVTKPAKPTKDKAAKK